MKKKLTLLVTVMCFGLVLVGCDKNSSKTEKVVEEEQKVSSEAVVTDDGVTIDGAKVKDIDVINVSTIYNFSIVFDNSGNDKVAKFDCSKISVRLGDTEMTIKYPEVKELTANESYIQWGLPMANTDELKVGDKVEIYYGDTKIGETEVR